MGKRLNQYLYFFKRLVFLGFLLLLFLFFWFGYYRLILPNNSIAKQNSQFLQLGKRSLIKWEVLNAATLKKAKGKNKLLFFVVGDYMDTNSIKTVRYFNGSPLISKLLNRAYVPVLIDKNLSPYFSQQLLEIMAYQKKNSRYPMVIVTTPSGVPLYFGSSISDVLEALTVLQTDWAANSGDTLVSANNYAINYRRYLSTNFKQIFNDETGISDLNFEPIFDQEFGGFFFPIKYLYMRQFNYLQIMYPTYFNHYQFTFNKIVNSPVYDFVSGGLFRASVSRDWNRPLFEKTFIDQVYFLNFILRLYQASMDPIYLDYINFNLDFVNSEFKRPNGSFRSFIKDNDNGEFYAFSKVALDAYAPLEFERHELTKDADLVSLVSPNDNNKVLRKHVLNLRKNRRDSRVFSGQSIPRDNARFLILLTELSQINGVRIDQSIISDLIVYLRSIDFSKMPFVDRLISYDAFMTLGLEKDARQIELNIWPELSNKFPFKDFYSDLNQDVFKSHFIDYYDTEMSLFYLLKYKNRFFPSLPTASICHDLLKIINKPFDQLSLIYLYKEACNDDSPAY